IFGGGLCPGIYACSGKKDCPMPFKRHDPLHSLLLTIYNNWRRRKNGRFFTGYRDKNGTPGLISYNPGPWECVSCLLPYSYLFFRVLYNRPNILKLSGSLHLIHFALISHSFCTFCSLTGERFWFFLCICLDHAC